MIFPQPPRSDDRFAPPDGGAGKPHPLARNRRLAQRWARLVKAGISIEDLSFFGSVSAVGRGGLSNAGRTLLPSRLMVKLLYLSHAFNQSDEDMIQRWAVIVP